MKHILEKNRPQGLMYTNSKDGWVNEDTFVGLNIMQHMPNVPLESSVPLILIYHSSHLSAFNYYKKTDKVMILTPSQSSHTIQPLEVSFYGGKSCLQTILQHVREDVFNGENNLV